MRPLTPSELRQLQAEDMEARRAKARPKAPERRQQNSRLDNLTPDPGKARTTDLGRQSQMQGGITVRRMSEVRI